MVEARIAVVIPAYCEEKTIGPVVAQASQYADVIVVDDCSVDGTAQTASSAGAFVVRSEINRGYDQTLSLGFETAAERGYTHVITMDADGEHAPQLIEKFIEALTAGKRQLVLGRRPAKQRFAEIVMGFVIFARFGVRDILCGMKAYDLALWRANKGFDHHEGIGTELAINALKAGIEFEEIPVFGKARADAPRFDRRFKANWRIFKALFGAAIRPSPLSPTALGT